MHKFCCRQEVLTQFRQAKNEKWGPGSASGKVLGYTMVRIHCRVGEVGNFSLLLHVQTCPGVHSAPYKMSTGDYVYVNLRF